MLYYCVSFAEFERVGHLGTTREIWSTLEKFHEGNDHIETRLFDTYQGEYKNFMKLTRETINTMFSRFQSIVNKIHANKAQLPYDDHGRALKLLHALDWRV
jgi:predicted choloylglycine hydrolase